MSNGRPSKDPCGSLLLFHQTHLEATSSLFPPSYQRLLRSTPTSAGGRALLIPFLLWSPRLQHPVAMNPSLFPPQGCAASGKSSRSRIFMGSQVRLLNIPIDWMKGKVVNRLWLIQRNRKGNPGVSPSRDQSGITSN